MDVLPIASSTQICEVAHDMELSLLRVRFHRNGQVREDYFEFSEVPRAVFDEFRRIEEDALHAGKQYGKTAKAQNVGLYYQGTLRALFIGVRVLPGGGRVRLA